VHDAIDVLCQIFTDFKDLFTDSLSNKPCLIWLLKIPPHLNYVTAVPCNLSLITALVCDRRSLSYIIVSRGSAAKHMRCAGIFSEKKLRCKFTGESESEKKTESRLRINRVTAVSEFGTRCTVLIMVTLLQKRCGDTHQTGCMSLSIGGTDIRTDGRRDGQRTVTYCARSVNNA